MQTRKIECTFENAKSFRVLTVGALISLEISLICVQLLPPMFQERTKK